MTTAKCIGDIVDKCQGTTDNEQILQRLVDKDKIMDTIKFFCDNLEGLFLSSTLDLSLCDTEMRKRNHEEVVP